MILIGNGPHTEMDGLKHWLNLIITINDSSGEHKFFCRLIFPDQCHRWLISMTVKERKLITPVPTSP
ncbi:MAG: hypothetical protein CMI18_07630 [Opitutaceae bacterium]|nr:hypothetical protein [Opitutaceae bacterium]